MASRENQGMQIALIILSALVLVFGAGFGYCFSKYKETRDIVAQREKDNAALQGIETALEGNIKRFREWMGFEKDELTAIEESFKADMLAYGDALGLNSRNYHSALGAARLMLDQKDVLLKTADDKLAAKEADKLQVEQQLKNDLAIANADKAKALEDLEKKSKEWADAVAAANAAKDALLAERTALKDQFDKAQAERADESAKSKAEIAQLEQALIRKNDQLRELRDETFEVADGAVTKVDARSGMVYIDLGSDDQLRPQIMFSVYGADEQVGGRQVRKAGIEIVEILGAKRAAAKIIAEDRREPILPGDQIHTPLWQSNRSEHVALAGVFDLDHDGRDDRDMLKRIISMGGGTLDDEVDGEGKRFGPGLDMNTRYLVMGEASKEAALDTLAKIRKDADLAGVTIVTVAKFLDHVGWANQHKLVQYGPKGNSAFVPPELPDGGLPSAIDPTAGKFKKRRPGARGRSAYSAEDFKSGEPAAKP